METGEPVTQMSLWIPLISAIGGGVITIFGQLFVHRVRERPVRKLDQERKKILAYMLDPKHMPKGVEWREIETLQRIIGASEQETKRLLIEIGARGSTLQSDVWALIKHKPFPKTAGVA